MRTVGTSLKLPHGFLVASCAIPVTLAFISPNLIPSPFGPRSILYTSDFASLFLEPWSATASLGCLISRTIQAYLFLTIQDPTPALAYCYALWMGIAFGRTLLGYILTRSVGWALPALFSHWSLYETTSGFGPSILVYFHVFGVPAVPAIQGREAMAMVALCGILALLDDAPWTYGVALIGASLLGLGMSVLSSSRPSGTILPPTITRPPAKPRRYLQIMVLSVVVVSFPHLAAQLLLPSPRTPMPSSPNGSPLLSIIVLSAPRPNTETSNSLLTITLESYTPFTGPDVTLSVFTHSRSNEGFKQALSYFDSQDANITFYTDEDHHDDSVDGQYLHMAEALRWEMEKPSTTRGQWVMLVEDDFPICHGERGWDVVRRIMTILESSRPAEKSLPTIRAGFVGTGGSGLIMHKSLIPYLIHILRTHAASKTVLPSGFPRRPPDVVIQDCLVGDDPSCPKGQPSEGIPAMVIPSRLMMDHIGGMASTNLRKAGNTDKWRCGWRHPFHGRPEVEVVVV